MAPKKRIKIFKNFEELEADDIKMNLDMTLQERFDAFWKMRQFHEQVFGDGQSIKKDPSAKKKLIISKPGWL